ncbi:uncharacterized protein L201_003700 [Kwoniella dendrophila CBS 6074]|uniref:Conidiation-specific protein 6 n=1 Tax=Kwoniella dendrophila CBS 6074 TaxID=1295534 RepID=A0AAX4JTU5_9TREE
MSSEHEHRQLGGYKATLHNPNTSPEAKAHAVEVLKEHGIDVNEDALTKKPLDGQTHNGQGHNGETHSNNVHSHSDGSQAEHEHRVMGGYKAALHNPNVSDEAKQHAQEVLKEGEEHEHRVLGGYKAALHNPNVSADAKEHAKDVLKDHHETA